MAIERERLIELRDNVLPYLRLRQYNQNTYCETKPHCGTVGCVGGWAAVHGPFVEQGLMLSKLTHVPSFHKSGYKYYGVQALALFFGLDNEEAHYIFGVKEDIIRCGYSGAFTPATAAQRITDVLEAQELIDREDTANDEEDFDA